MLDDPYVEITDFRQVLEAQHVRQLAFFILVEIIRINKLHGIGVPSPGTPLRRSAPTVMFVIFVSHGGSGSGSSSMHHQTFCRSNLAMVYSTFQDVAMRPKKIFVEILSKMLQWG
jgi:hypothetical protein